MWWRGGGRWWQERSRMKRGGWGRAIGFGGGTRQWARVRPPAELSCRRSAGKPSLARAKTLVEQGIKRGSRFTIDGVVRHRGRLENIVRRVFTEPRQDFLLNHFGRDVETQIPGSRRESRLERTIFGQQVIECVSVLIAADNDQISLHAPLLITADIELEDR